MRAFFQTGVLALAVGLSACSSSSDSNSQTAAGALRAEGEQNATVAYSGPKLPITITEANATTTASARTPPNVEAATANVKTAGGVPSSFVKDVKSITALAIAQTQTNSKLQTRQTINEKFACNGGGTVITTGDVKNPNSDFPSAGDWTVTTFDNCVMSAGFSFHGKVSSSTIRFDDQVESTSVGFLGFTLNMDGMSFSLDGGFDDILTYTGNADSSRMRGAALRFKIVSNGETEEFLLTNFDMSTTENWVDGTTTDIMDFTMASVALGGRVVVDTTVPFVTGWDGVAVSGEMVITGADNTKVKIVVENGGVVAIYWWNPELTEWKYVGDSV